MNFLNISIPILHLSYKNCFALREGVMFSRCTFNNCIFVGRSFQKPLTNKVKSNTFSPKVNATLDCPTFSTNVNSRILESVRTNDSNVDDGDNFGSLTRSLEKNKSKSKNVKVIRVKNNFKSNKPRESDVFGNLSAKKPMWYPDFNEDSNPENDQNDDSFMVRNISKKYRLPEEYLNRMKEFVAEKKIKEALELFVDMKRNRFKPERLHFTYMIGVCGRYGFNEMAFKLLKQITDRGLRPTSATLTALFNACGQSPFSELGLKRAQVLREKIQQKNWTLNQITYHAMIKAFGKCGDIQTAFQIVDEMVEAKVKIDASTYCFLLMSCISNKDAGFTHAIEVWRKMKKMRCLPTLYSFNLLLRAARECDIGPEEVSSLLLQHWSSFSARPYGLKTKQPQLPRKEVLQLQGAGFQADSKIISCQVVNDEDSNVTEEGNEPAARSLKRRDESQVEGVGQGVLPSILNIRPLQRVEVFGLSDIKTASDRLMLLGGVDEILANMKELKVKPDIKTFTLLLQCLPPDTSSEEHLIKLLDDHKVKPDTGFFNILIKRRNFRFDSSGAHEALMLMNKWSLSPDVITFGVLALGCRNHRQYNVFISDMEKLGVHPNIEIAETLLTSACTIVDFVYIYDVLMLIDDLNLSATESMLKKIEKVLENSRKNTIEMEQGKDVHECYKRKGFKEKYKEFCKLYEKWLKKTQLEKEQHVWDQFRTNIVEKSFVHSNQS